MLSRSFAAVLAASCLLTASPLIRAQQQQPRPDYTLQASSRLVLTDVVVTDSKGNPVHGLKSSDFQILDDNKPQILASFEEHATAPVALLPQASITPGVYSNQFMMHLPPVLNIIVIDITHLNIPDQMYLNYELTRFINHLPPDQPIAIYWSTGPVTVPLQSFTSDRALLLAAVHKALPHFPPIGRFYYSDFSTLHQIAVDLGQVPGRKNILWFSGGSTLFLQPDPTVLQSGYDYRYIYDELESSRIAIYPIDARGLSVTEPFHIWAGHALMNDIAETTGGHAYYNNNGLDKIAATWLDKAGDFYTLTYSPANFRLDRKWHKVHVKLTGEYANYTLSYRHGYYADPNFNGARRPQKPRQVLLSGGETMAKPDIRSEPIVFEARVLPASQTPPAATQGTAEAVATQLPPKKGTTPYSIRYMLPAGAFTPKNADGKDQIELGVAFAFNDEGSATARLADRVTLTVNTDKLRQSPNALIPVDQQINLRKGQNFLYFAVWDMTSGRLGTLQVPLQVAAAVGRSRK
jgi:VWFA-related protein